MCLENVVFGAFTQCGIHENPLSSSCKFYEIILFYINELKESNRVEMHKLRKIREAIQLGQRFVFYCVTA